MGNTAEVRVAEIDARGTPTKVSFPAMVMEINADGDAVVESPVGCLTVELGAEAIGGCQRGDIVTVTLPCRVNAEGSIQIEI